MDTNLSVFSKKTIFVTGGAGFVGSYFALFCKLKSPQSRVIAFDNLKRRGSELNLPRLREAGVEFVHGDVRNPTDLDLPHIDYILECSAEPSAFAGREGGIEYLVHTNLLGTYNCLELARKHRAQMIFLSTSRVYPIASIQQLFFEERDMRFVLGDVSKNQGVSEKGIAENFPLQGPRTLYGSTKLASELLIQEYVDNFNLDIVINRCGVIAGPWQMGKVDQGFVVLWLARHFFGGELSYIGYGGSGKQVRDLLHIADLADLIWLQMQAIKPLVGHTFNVGGGIQNSVSLLELTNFCQEITGKKIQINTNLNDRPGDVPWFITDSTKVQRQVGWMPKRNIFCILRDIHTWIINNESSLRSILS